MYDEFFRIEESEQYAFYRIPKLLFSNKRFWNLSADAKLLYGLLLDPDGFITEKRLGNKRRTSLYHLQGREYHGSSEIWK